MHYIYFLCVCVCRDMRIGDNLLSKISSVVQMHKKLQLRSKCSEERVWRSHLNYCMAQAHLALLYQDLDQLHEGPLQFRFVQTLIV